MTLKNDLQEHFKIYFPNLLVEEFKSKGVVTLDQAIERIDKKYKKRVYRYILNNYDLADISEQIAFKGSVIVVDPKSDLYSSGLVMKIEDQVGLGAIDSLFKGLKSVVKKPIEIEHYGSSAIKSLSEGVPDTVTSSAKVMTIMGVKNLDNGKVYWGIGESSNALRSAVDSLLSAINRMEMIEDRFEAEKDIT